MKIAITGHQGKIGRRLVNLGALPLYCDITNDSQVAMELQRVKPGVVIHCAAMSGIEECENNYEKAIQVNLRGTNIVAEESGKVGAKIVLLSSEQIFDGKWGNYKENSTPNPINNYGLTKLAAEGMVFMYDGKVIRLSRCVSKSDPEIQDILCTEMDIPTFIKRSYCHLDFVAQAIFQFANRFNEMPDVMNYGGKDTVSYYGFAKMLNENTHPRRGATLSHHPRPFRCGLNTKLAEKLGFQLYTIKETVDRILHE